MDDNVFESNENSDEILNKIHVSIDKAKGKKKVTKVYGFSKSFFKKDDKTKLSKIDTLVTKLKKKLSCGGCSTFDKVLNKETIKLQGSHMDSVIEFLIESKVINNESDVEKHGLN